MPHVVLDATPLMADVARGFAPQLERWGRAVLKTEGCWLRQGREGMLVEGVVVEFQRPVALECVAEHGRRAGNGGGFVTAPHLGALQRLDQDSIGSP